MTRVELRIESDLSEEEAREIMREARLYPQKLSTPAFKQAAREIAYLLIKRGKNLKLFLDKEER